MNIIQGDALTVLRGLPSESVHMVVTSPPYWALRDYGTASWEGGDPACDHKQGRSGSGRADGIVDERSQRNRDGVGSMGGDCGKCGARRIDQQLGLEAVHDCMGWATGDKCGACYICKMVAVFSEVRRVLRDDATCWVNMGDSYAAGKTGRSDADRRGVDGFTGSANTAAHTATREPPPGLKPKDLCMMPWRLALAMQADGWYLRDVIVWDKPAPMPESVRDRCTKSWEPIFMFAKSARYYFDAEAIREKASYPDGPNSPESIASPYGQGFTRRATGGRQRALSGEYAANEFKTSDERNTRFQGADPQPGTRNKRNVWRLPPMPTPDAHFATFPIELPETCILAGTSERGVCPTCGAPWRRIVERSGGKWEELKANGAPMRWGSDNLEARSAVHVGGSTSKTTGWRASCEHGGEPIPATVMDPFCGAGTTGLAANKHGRRFIGIELSEAYIKISNEREYRHQPLSASVCP